jgi:3-oxoacyl-[acyl-carrier protein] reductase
VEHKVALVTGAGSPSGIGFATARLLANDGFDVAIGSTTERIRDREAQLAAEGHLAFGVVADLTDSTQTRRMVEEVLGRFGRVDALVNNAGMAAVNLAPGGTTPISELVESAWDLDIALNLKTAFNVTRAILPQMIERGYGRVVMVSSVTGPLVSNPGSAGYSAAKAGMDGLMRAAALDVARRGITVNSVAPGWIATGSQLPQEKIAGEKTPVGRSGTAEEVAAVVAFLCSERAGYVTGQSIVVDGGNTIQEYKGSSEAWY